MNKKMTPIDHDEPVSLSATAWRLLVLATIATELLPDRPEGNEYRNSEKKNKVLRLMW